MPDESPAGNGASAHDTLSSRSPDRVESGWRTPMAPAKSGSREREPAAPPEPPPDCGRCPRLVAFRKRNRERFPDFYNAAVPSFGDPHAHLLIVGLAPGLKGANRTGRPFTGDHAGEILYHALIDAGLAQGEYRARADDGLVLRDVMITNSVRCVPPENRPTPVEIARCRPYLRARIESLPQLRAVLALGRIAHDSVIAALGGIRARHPFAHGAEHRFDGLVLIDSYHCSRYNMNTGRLTSSMFAEVLTQAIARASV